MSAYNAWAVTAAAINPDTPRHALENPGITVYDRDDIVSWQSLSTGWEISNADGAIDTEKAAALLAEAGWALEPDETWHATASAGKYIAGVVPARTGG